jgi:NAD-dependent SIR2 family protein deacetylase
MNEDNILSQQPISVDMVHVKSAEQEDKTINNSQMLGVPHCSSCFSLARPAVVWFGESLKPSDWERSVRASYCDTMVVVGTSAMVNPVASLPELAQKNRARIIVVNAEKTTIAENADVFLQGKAGDILPRLCAKLESGIDGMYDMDMGKAMVRGLEKFYAKYPTLKPYVEGSGGKVE